jgi:hypothetical protein
LSAGLALTRHAGSGFGRYPVSPEKFYSHNKITAFLEYIGSAADVDY